MSRTYARAHLSSATTGAPVALSGSWQTVHTAVNAASSHDETFVVLHNGTFEASCAIQIRIGGTALLRFFVAPGATHQALPGILLSNGATVEVRLEAGSDCWVYGYINAIRPI